MARKKSKNKRKKSKERIPKAIREQTWLKSFGKKYEHKCYISWCDNIISVFDFHVGHDKPESKGGKLRVDNLKPICARCNLSMSNNYTITEWDKLNNTQSSCCGCFKFW
jgi:5-methylcytosine-specific restriction endonuclease McrA